MLLDNNRSSKIIGSPGDSFHGAFVQMDGERA